MDLFVKFWGTRGSIPTPGYQTRKYGGNTTCIEVRHGDTLMICDGGTGIRELGLDLLRRSEMPIKAHMFFSHMHFDHIQGFPFFKPGYIPSNSFHIYGQNKDDRRHFDLLSGQMSSDDYFPVSFSDLGANIAPGDLGEANLLDGGFQLDQVLVKSYRQMHPGGSYSYSFEADGRKVVFSTDNEIDLTLQNKDEVGKDPNARREVPAEFVKFCEGADLLICDGQYTDEEYAIKVGWGHPRATTCVDLALAAGVKRLAITHHDPMQDDDSVEQKILACRRRARMVNPDLVIFGAREGLELRLQAEGFDKAASTDSGE